MKADRETLSDTASVQERLRAAAESAAATGRGMEHQLHQRHANQRAAATERARQAREWARSQWSDLQERVERRPYSATAWALGLGFVSGIVITSMLRANHREHY
jgi:hypothetical protein